VRGLVAHIGRKGLVHVVQDNVSQRLGRPERLDDAVFGFGRAERNQLIVGRDEGRKSQRDKRALVPPDETHELYFDYWRDRIHFLERLSLD
jgi:hypothetical protein